MIPVFDPVIGKDEIDAVVAALRRGEISGTFGKTIPEFEQKFAAYCGCKIRDKGPHDLIGNPSK